DTRAVRTTTPADGPGTVATGVSARGAGTGTVTRSTRCSNPGRTTGTGTVRNWGTIPKAAPAMPRPGSAKVVANRAAVTTCRNATPGTGRGTITTRSRSSARTSGTTTVRSR